MEDGQYHCPYGGPFYYWLHSDGTLEPITL